MTLGEAGSAVRGGGGESTAASPARQQFVLQAALARREKHTRLVQRPTTVYFSTARRWPIAAKIAASKTAT